MTDIPAGLTPVAPYIILLQTDGNTASLVRRALDENPAVIVDGMYEVKPVEITAPEGEQP